MWFTCVPKRGSFTVKSVKLVNKSCGYWLEVRTVLLHQAGCESVFIKNPCSLNSDAWW